jgi:sugar phosphate isomerase/epimerase
MLKAALIGFYDFRQTGPWEVIKKISGWGYKALEHGGFLFKGDLDENLKKLSEMNFSVLSVSADVDGFKNNLGEIISNAKKIRVKNVICFWSDPRDYAQAIEFAKVFDRAGETLRKEGLCLCYHNHDHEFKKVINGLKYFDLLLAETSPENLFLNLDAGWAAVGGEDVPKLMERVRDRIKLMHFKDFYDLNDRTSFTALGTGKVKIQDLVVKADEIGLDYITVEQDAVRNLNADDTVLLSYLTLKESGLVE